MGRDSYLIVLSESRGWRHNADSFGVYVLSFVKSCRRIGVPLLLMNDSERRFATWTNGLCNWLDNSVICWCLVES